MKTKSPDEEKAYSWTSEGVDGYTIEECEKEENGTEIILHIKEDTEEEKYSEFIDEYKIRNLVKRYSDYIRYPIQMEVEHSHKKEGTENEYEQVKEQRIQAEEKQKNCDAHKKKQEKLLAEQEILTQKRETVTEVCYQIRAEQETASEMWKSLANELPYETEQELQQNLQRAEQEKAELEQRKEELEKRLQELQQLLANQQGALVTLEEHFSQLKEELTGKEKIDTSSLKEEAEQLEAEQKQLEQRRMELAGNESRNQQALKNLKALYQERTALEKEYTVISTLDRTANGNLNQQARLDLQTYVQRRYFKYIVAEANRRLVKMSGSQFILQCRDMENLGKRGEVGLDLDVYDLVTDKVRDVKTLSGGESFMAALSMALGMADIIQRMAGRVHLDTMFIDEGFGSLDEEARSKAIGILTELAGEHRLVGIISHVTELKEQIDRKLVVSKTEKGSRATWVLES